MSGARLISAADREWVAGMVWRSFQDTPKTAELRVDAQDLHAEWMAVRSTSHVVQTGFCQAVNGRHPRGLYSLAAAIAESQEQPWLGVYRLSDDLWWYLAVRDGQAVLPDGDVVGNRAAVMEARDRHASFTDWHYVEGALADLLPILSAPRSRTLLVPVKSVEPISPLKVVLPPLAVCLAAAAGAWWWHQRAEADARARQAALAAARARILAEQRAVSPLLSTPAPAAWLAGCAAVLDGMPVSEGGWRLVRVACVGNGVTVVWKREDGATVAERPPGALATNGNSVTQTIRMPPLGRGRDDASGLQASDKALYELLQPLGVQAVISAPPAPPRLPGSASAKPPPIPTQSVRFDLPVAPFDVDFSGVPGLRLVSAEQQKRGWSVQGTIYGR